MVCSESNSIHIVRLLVSQYPSHKSRAVYILYWAPVVPRIFPIVQIAEDCDFEGAVLPEHQPRFVRIRIQVIDYKRIF